MSTLLLQGMQGLGDNLHQRAIIRQMLQKHTLLILETPWPSIVHDFVGPNLRLVPSKTGLRTQANNVRREHAKFTGSKVTPRAHSTVRVWYTGEMVRRTGSILAAMMESVGCDYASADFRLPVPAEWSAQLDRLLPRTSKPIMVYRPLVERTEWAGCVARNPDFAAYHALFQAVRDRFFVVSIADLLPGKEWIAGTPIVPDVAFHAGELPLELLAALTKRAALMFCSPGFAPLLAQAVGTPSVCVFGGHENSTTIAGGARYTPTLGIDPIVPCHCFDKTHRHLKAIDVAAATARLLRFVDTHCATTREKELAC